MQIVQRSMLLLIVVVCLTAGIAFLCGEQEEKGRKQWEQIQTEVFLNRISREGLCSYEEYLVFCTGLEAYGGRLEVRLEEYQQEKDRNGQTYWYLVSWEEIRDILLMEGVYYFQANSALKLRVKQSGRIGSGVKDYYDIVS